jgi:hypothetical protein
MLTPHGLDRNIHTSLDERNLGVDAGLPALARTELFQHLISQKNGDHIALRRTERAFRTPLFPG